MTWQRYQPHQRRWLNKRAEDLDEALRNGKGKKRRGNHFVEIVDSILPADIDLCKDCNLNLRCLSGKQIDFFRASDERRSCYAPDNQIKFYYHDTCCLTFDIKQRRVTDHNMYGHSVTTSKSIRHYLEALWDNDYFHPRPIGHDDITALIKAFKKFEPKDKRDELWLDV